MEQKPAAPSREERLAAKLRENLRRRKAQARAMTAPEGGDPLPRSQQGLDESPPDGADEE